MIDGGIARATSVIIGQTAPELAPSAQSNIRSEGGFPLQSVHNIYIHKDGCKNMRKLSFIDISIWHQFVQGVRTNTVIGRQKQKLTFIVVGNAQWIIGQSFSNSSTGTPILYRIGNQKGSPDLKNIIDTMIYIDPTRKPFIILVADDALLFKVAQRCVESRFLGSSTDTYIDDWSDTRYRLPDPANRWNGSGLGTPIRPDLIALDYPVGSFRPKKIVLTPFLGRQTVRRSSYLPIALPKSDRPGYCIELRSYLLCPGWSIPR